MFELNCRNLGKYTFFLNQFVNLVLGLGYAKEQRKYGEQNKKVSVEMIEKDKDRESRNVKDGSKG